MNWLEPEEIERWLAVRTVFAAVAVQDEALEQFVRALAAEDDTDLMNYPITLSAGLGVLARRWERSRAVARLLVAAMDGDCDRDHAAAVAWTGGAMKAEERLAEIDDESYCCSGEEGRDFDACAALAREAIALLRGSDKFLFHFDCEDEISHCTCGFAGYWQRYQRFLDGEEK